jgi:hypothetical protein
VITGEVFATLAGTVRQDAADGIEASKVHVLVSMC